MPKCPHCKKVIPLIADKNILLLYSLYLALGSIALFVCLNNLYTTSQAIIWKYSVKYIVNSLTLVLASFVSGLFFLIACFWMIQSKKIAKMIGLFGCIFLIVYPLYVLYINMMMPYSFTYLMILCIPAVVVAFLSILWRKKY